MIKLAATALLFVAAAQAQEFESAAPKVAPPPMPCYLVWLKELPISAQLAQCDTDALAYIGSIIQRRDAVYAERGKRNVWNSEITRLIVWRHIAQTNNDMAWVDMINNRMERVLSLIERSNNYERSLSDN